MAPQEGDTPLIDAVRHGRIAVVAVLIAVAVARGLMTRLARSEEYAV